MALGGGKWVFPGGGARRGGTGWSATYVPGRAPAQPRRQGPDHPPSLVAGVRAAREGSRRDRSVRLHRNLERGLVPGSGRRGCRGNVVGGSGRLRVVERTA